MPTIPADAAWLSLAAAAGGCIALQATANAALKHQLGDGRYAAFFSICGTILSAVLFMLAVRPVAPAAAAIRSAPWWNWIGGPLGAMIVLAGATLTPKLGAAAFIAAVVGGQLVCSLALDHFGMMNLPQQGLSASRLLGAAMVFAGVLLVRYG
jgi:bacterial/archaeal transporter family-2 protein